MRLITWNVNGFRSVHKKGFADWFRAEKADFICLQEIKVQPEQVDETLRNPGKYHSYWHAAEKPGYSGLVVFSKREEPENVRLGLGDPVTDREGRVLELQFKKFTLINAYFPNSQRDHARLPYKLEFCKAMLARLEELRGKGRQVILCGDFNIAHREIDLKNPKSNRDNAGFLPAERAWMDLLLEGPYVDAFRKFQPDPFHYTWWSYRPGVRAKNVGWRLDYFVTTDSLTDRLKGCVHRTDVMGSDHCPVRLELKS